MQSDTSQKTSEEQQIQNKSTDNIQNPESFSPDSELVSGKKAVSGKEVSTRKQKIRYALWFFCGGLWGAALMFIGIVLYLRHNLIQEIPMEKDFVQIADMIGPVALKYGWQVSCNQCGMPRVINNQPVEVYRMCKTPYAQDLLSEENDRKISCILPCSIAIYRKSDGITYISKLNMPLVTQLLGGTSVGIFYEKIAPEQNAIMSHFPVHENKKK